MELVLTARGVAASYSRSGSGANTDQCGLQLGSVIEEVTLNSCVVGKPEVIRFISHAAQWCRFFRCSLACPSPKLHRPLESTE